MRRHSEENDANRVVVLAITTVLTLVVMAAIAAELPSASAATTGLVKLVGTCSPPSPTWSVRCTTRICTCAAAMTGRTPEASIFQARHTLTTSISPISLYPGHDVQTSDTAITSQAIRRIVTLHLFAAFVFNIGVIAFTINALGGGHEPPIRSISWR
jgi:hypothetical protein